MEKKTCVRCKEEKEIGLFYVTKVSKDGHRHYCKDCDRVCNAEWQKKNKVRMNDLRREYMKEWQHKPSERIKASAREKVRDAIVKGLMQKMPCEICGNEKAHAHHNDYLKPLEVVWLCDPHHKEEHKNMKLRPKTPETHEEKLAKEVYDRAMAGEFNGKAGLKIIPLLNFIRTVEQNALQRGREEAVDYIREQFNDERYAEIWPESERDEDDTEGSAAEFWMFFNPILDEARSGTHDVCDKHRAPDCMKCFYTTRAETPPEETTGETV